MVRSGQGETHKHLHSTAHRWGWLTIVLHWLIAAAVVGLFALGLWMVELNYYSEWYQRAPWIHRSAGILLLGLMGIRALWRLRETTPSAAAGVGAGEQRLARATHRLMILLIVVVIGSGYLISTADGRAIDVFGWFELPALPWAAQRQEDLAGLVHKWLAIVLVSLAGLHALAAIKHHAVDRDDTLLRMLGRSRRLASKDSTHKPEHMT